MALLPLLWLGGLAWHHQRRPVLWWALAIVLSVSWVADTAAHWMDPWIAMAIYPAIQALVLGAVLLPMPALGRFAALIVAATVLPLLYRGVAHPDIFARTACWAGLLTIAWPYREIRFPVLVTFGLGWLAWLGYNFAPSWGTWGTYQSIRAVGLGTFCWATLPLRVRA